MEEANMTPTTPEAPSAAPVLAVRYAGFWWRFLAYLIDSVIFAVIFGGLLSVLPKTEQMNTVIGLIALVVGWVYYALMESSVKQGTLGKIAVGIKVTDMQGNRISLGRATGRHFAKIISAVIFYIGFLMVAFTAKKQALHDMIASCLVVKK